MPARLAPAGRRQARGGIEDYLHEISTASAEGRHRIGDRYGIRVIPDEPYRTS